LEMAENAAQERRDAAELCKRQSHYEDVLFQTDLLLLALRPARSTHTDGGTLPENVKTQAREACSEALHAYRRAMHGLAIARADDRYFGYLDSLCESVIVGELFLSGRYGIPNRHAAEALGLKLEETAISLRDSLAQKHLSTSVSFVPVATDKAVNSFNDLMGRLARGE
jgi:hypothetical protein